MKSYLFTLLLCIMAMGCRHVSYSNNSKLIIYPGVGISNVIELGMDPREIARRTGDLVVKDLNGMWLLSVPSLGASWEQERNDQPLPWICFFVVSEMINVVPDNRFFCRFRGNVNGGLSFADNGGVTGGDVIGLFGTPQHILREAVIERKHANDMRKWGVNGDAYALQNPLTGAETLVYPKRGISFGLHSNTVVMVNIFHPRDHSKRGQ